MKLSRKRTQSLPLNILLSLAYGFFVYLTARSWSFDYQAIVDTIKYFQSDNLSYLSILAFNSFSTYGLTKLLNGYQAEYIASLFYGICAALRFFVYSVFFKLVWFVPIFFSMAVMLDYNMSRYSLATTLFIFIFGILHRNNLNNMGFLKTGLIITLFFHLHHFASAFIALFSRTSLLFRFAAVSVIPICVFLFEPVFSRFLSETDGDFPRISLVYLALVLFLVASMKMHISEWKPIVSVIALLLSFQLSGIQFNSAYYTRFAFLAFEVTLITIALNTTAYSFQRNGITVNTKYLRVLIACIISTTYQAILINGNIWRFF